jgi:hypothetical protein
MHAKYDLWVQAGHPHAWAAVQSAYFPGAGVHNHAIICNSSQLLAFNTAAYILFHTQGWIPRLERKLEIAAETAHPDFRCFFSAEPINGAPHAKIIPESILQTCIKVSPASSSHCTSLHTFHVLVATAKVLVLS